MCCGPAGCCRPSTGPVSAKEKRGKPKRAAVAASAAAAEAVLARGVAAAAEAEAERSAVDAAASEREAREPEAGGLVSGRCWVGCSTGDIGATEAARRRGRRAAVEPCATPAWL